MIKINQRNAIITAYFNRKKDTLQPCFRKEKFVKTCDELVYRTKTNNMDVLNRERQDFYELEIKTRVRDKENRRIGKSNTEASTIVRVKVKDVNDLDPFFQPSSYAFTVAEDTPLHQVGKITIM